MSARSSWRYFLRRVEDDQHDYRPEDDIDADHEQDQLFAPHGLEVGPRVPHQQHQADDQRGDRRGQPQIDRRCFPAIESSQEHRLRDRCCAWVQILASRDAGLQPPAREKALREMPLAARAVERR